MELNKFIEHSEQITKPISYNLFNENNDIILKTVPMKIGEGIEIRIYDHFPTKYLYSLFISQNVIMLSDTA